MEGFIFLVVLVILAAVVLFVIGLSKIFSTYSKLDSLFLKLGSIEEEIRKLHERLESKPSKTDTTAEPQQKQENPLSVVHVEVRENVEPDQFIQTTMVPAEPVALDREVTINPVADLDQGGVFEKGQEVGEVILSEEKSILSTEPLAADQQIPRERIPRKKSALELFFSENLLTKIGIITFVLGIGFFVKYAIDQEWINEVGRVGIGILTGGIMIGIAHRLRKTLSVFSSLLVGGGISVFYITITLAFREYELFSQTIAFVILILITCFSVALSLLYNRKELAVFSLLGGFMAPLMVSTGTGNYIVLFSYIFILNSGMLYLSFKKNWIVVGYVAFVLTAVFKLTWVTNGFVDQYLGASVFAALFFVQFYSVALLNTAKSKRIMLHVLLIILNNMVFLGVFLYLFENYEGVNLKGLIVLAFAAVNLIVLMYLWKKKKINSLYLYTVLGIVVSLITLAVPVQLDGHYITMFWAVEIVVLLVLHVKSKLKIFYSGFLAVSVLALISYMIDAVGMDKGAYSDLIFNRLFVTGLVVFTSFFMAQTILKKQRIATAETLLLPYVLRIIAFVVPALELNKELYFLSENAPIGVFDTVAMTIYGLTYAAVIFLISTKSKLNYVINWIFLVVFTLLLWGSFPDLRMEIFVEGLLSVKYFLIVFLAVPGLVILIRQLYRNAAYKNTSKIIRWFLPVIALLLLCVFIDNSAMLLYGMQNPMDYGGYHTLIRNTHVIVYPIIWGAIALLMTYWGIKKQLVFLRQIALALLGLTIVKFYVLDVWSMSEGGKVLSFVLLGLIILVIAFLLNRIKGLLGQGEKESRDEEILDNDDKLI